MRPRDEAARRVFDQAFTTELEREGQAEQITVEGGPERYFDEGARAVEQRPTAEQPTQSVRRVRRALVRARGAGRSSPRRAVNRQDDGRSACQGYPLDVRGLAMARDRA